MNDEPPTWFVVIACSAILALFVFVIWAGVRAVLALT